PSQVVRQRTVHASVSGCRLCLDAGFAHRAPHSFPTRRSSDLSAPTTSSGSCVATTAAPSASHRATSTSRSWRLSRSTATPRNTRSEEHTAELQSQSKLVCRLKLDKINCVITNVWPDEIDYDID